MQPQMSKTSSDELERQIAAALQRYRELSPEQKREMHEAQRKSWVIGEMLLEHPDMTREYAENIYNRVSEPFPRQMRPVKVTFYGDRGDIIVYRDFFAKIIEGRGDNVEHRLTDGFTIYPRAVND